MPVDPEFKRAIEEIKLRAPIEEIVREALPELRKRGRLWEACCPFHEEKTPSFKVDPSRSTWRCYGSCQDGGDVISFVMRSQNLEFMDAAELLAARTGVEIPRKGGGNRNPDEDPGFAALKEAEDFFREALKGAEGREARDYLDARKMGANTRDAFGLGWAPRSGAALEQHARKSGIPRKIWEDAGLLRIGEDGSAYSFFRGRFVIPIRDLKGRTVGFGARRLGDGENSGPKYINTPETPWFHKGRLIYGLDRAVDHVRRGAPLILVEGYTDVMAAHQAGIPNVCAVLGTATTDDHARLVRRSGASRICLVFDGDDAGRSAAYKALYGLLPLDVEIVVASLPGGQDPADVLQEGGSEPFLAQLELADGWFSFVLQGLAGLESKALAKEVDRVLELLDRLTKAVQRDALMKGLADHVGMPLETIREAWRALPERRREALAASGSSFIRESEPSIAPGAGAGRASARPTDPQVLEAYRAIVGALLVDNGLVPRVRAAQQALDGKSWLEVCPCPDLSAILATLSELFDDEEADMDPSSVMNALGAHPSRERVLMLHDHAKASDFPSQELLSTNLDLLRHKATQKKVKRITERLDELETGSAEDAEARAAEMERLQRELQALLDLGTSPPDTDTHPPGPSGGGPEDGPPLDGPGSERSPPPHDLAPVVTTP